MGAENGVDVRKIEAEENFLIDVQFLLQEVMNERGLNRADVARLAGISKARLTQIMRDDANPTIKSIVNLFYALGVEIEPIRKGYKIVTAELDHVDASVIDTCVTDTCAADNWREMGTQELKELAPRGGKKNFRALVDHKYRYLELEADWHLASNDNPAFEANFEYATG
jgi:transcriptional regulator with XRE-family HTH domain